MTSVLIWTFQKFICPHCSFSYSHSDVVQVFDEEAGTLGLKYTSFIPLLTQAVKELDAALKKSQQALQEQQAAFDLKLAQQQKEIEELKLLIKGN